MTLWRYFTEKEIKIRLSLIALFLCFVKFQLIFVGSLIFKSVYMFELFSTLVYNYLLITNVAKSSALDVVGALDPPLLLKEATKS